MMLTVFAYQSDVVNGREEHVVTVGNALGTVTVGGNSFPDAYRNASEVFHDPEDPRSPFCDIAAGVDREFESLDEGYACWLSQGF